MARYNNIDSYNSFRLVEKQVGAAVASGELTKEKARDILEGARKSYRNNGYNKAVDRSNKHEKVYN